MLDGHQQYKRLFRNKVDAHLLCCVYYNASLETVGDVYSSVALSLAYKGKLHAVHENEI